MAGAYREAFPFLAENHMDTRTRSVPLNRTVRVRYTNAQIACHRGSNSDVAPSHVESMSEVEPVVRHSSLTFSVAC
jgi:hypothetical protein